MKGILLLNGRPYGGKIEAGDAYVVCCDGAYAWAKDKAKIDENVGDFDSLSLAPVPPPRKVYPSEKNFTDGEIGLELLLSRGCEEIEVYGGGGAGRTIFWATCTFYTARNARACARRCSPKAPSSFPPRAKRNSAAGRGRPFRCCLSAAARI